MGKYIASGFCDVCTTNGRMVRAVPGQRLCRECMRALSVPPDEPLPQVNIPEPPVARPARTPAGDVRFIAEGIVVIGIVSCVLFFVSAAWSFAQDSRETTTDGFWLVGFGIGAGLSSALWSTLVRGFAYGLELLEQIRDGLYGRVD